jgi:hypothetical protein
MNLPNVIHLPSDEEAERSRRFTVHRHYLGSVELMLAALYGMGDDQPAGLLAAQRRLPAFTRIQRRAVANPAELRRLLAISWASEIQLRLADVGGDSFLRYSNAWGPVQAYYAVYMSIHAYLSTVGMGGLVDDHTSTLRTAVSQVVLRGLLPHPWDMTCAGCPELGTRVINGVPAGMNPDAHFENLAGPTLEDFYPRFAKMLDSTRTQRLERNRREWLARSGRKRMPRAEKEAAASRLHPTTVFDYLWRLRIRSNYGDVSAFLMSGVDDRSHAAFHRGLVTLASGTCLLLQSLIVAYVGPGPYETALNEFTAGGGIALAGPVGFLQQRGDLLAPSRATSR